MDDGFRHYLPGGFQYARRALYIGIVGVQRRVKTGEWKALRRQMKNVVGLGLAYCVLHRKTVAQIGIDQMYPLFGVDSLGQIVQVDQRAAPAGHAPDIPVGFFV